MTDMPSPRDPVVSRVNELATTALDTLAVLGIAAGLAVWMASWAGWGPAIAAGAALLGLLSFALQWVQRDRPASRSNLIDADPLPGPTDPGPLHVMGR